jgi:predicted  nucleic acid-binding Zn-ribbon protein
LFIGYQWITIAVYDHKIKKLEAQIADEQEKYEKAETELEVTRSDINMSWLYWEYEAKKELGNK